MSDDNGDDEYKVGHRKPPQEHQFKGGRSGNPKGRPKKVKRERAYSLRQNVRDVLSVTEQEVIIRAPKGPKKAPLITAVLMKMAEMALKGHAPSQRFICRIHAEALLAHEAAHLAEFDMLEQQERILFRDSSLESGQFADFLNQLRKLSRKI